MYAQRMDITEIGHLAAEIGIIIWRGLVLGFIIIVFMMLKSAIPEILERTERRASEVELKGRLKYVEDNLRTMQTEQWKLRAQVNHITAHTKDSP